MESRAGSPSGGGARCRRRVSAPGVGARCRSRGGPPMRRRTTRTAAGAAVSGRRALPAPCRHGGAGTGNDRASPPDRIPLDHARPDDHSRFGASRLACGRPDRGMQRPLHPAGAGDLREHWRAVRCRQAVPRGDRILSRGGRADSGGRMGRGAPGSGMPRANRRAHSSDWNPRLSGSTGRHRVSSTGALLPRRTGDARGCAARDRRIPWRNPWRACTGEDARPRARGAWTGRDERTGSRDRHRRASRRARCRGAERGGARHRPGPGLPAVQCRAGRRAPRVGGRSSPSGRRSRRRNPRASRDATV